MKREIYEAMQRRIEIMPFASGSRAYDELGWGYRPDSIFYIFKADGLGDEVDSIIQPMETKNIWNVAERFYSFLRIHDDIDALLLAAGTNE